MSQRHVFAVAQPALGLRRSNSLFPVRRIFCVGRNYAAHAREMGGDPEREPPFFFTKPADAVVPGGGPIPYPPHTQDLHHEVELVVALGRGGRALTPSACRELIYAYGVGIDFTRRDLQRAAKAAGRPWDMAKGFDGSAPCSPLSNALDIGHPRSGFIGLEVNGELRQSGDISDLIWSPEETLAHLSQFVALAPGDLVFTGTPAGVGPLLPGDSYRAWIDGVGELSGAILPSAGPSGADQAPPSPGSKG